MTARKFLGRFRTVDTLLSAETTAFNRSMNGRVWAGNLTSQLKTMGTADRKIALDALRSVLDEFEGEIGSTAMGPSDSGSFGTGRSAAQMNDAFREFWDARGNAPVTIDRAHAPANRLDATVQGINSANAEFWKRQNAHQQSARREWGRG